MGTEDSELVDSTQLLERLRKMDPIDFEKFCADLWQSMGWEAEIRQASRDAGVDVILHRNDGGLNQQAVLQAKRYAAGNKVGSEDIQQYGSLRQQESADHCLVVTTSEFTGPAEDRAEELNVDLIDGRKLVQIIERENAADLVNQYAPASGDETEGATKTPTESDIERTKGAPAQRVSELRSLLNNPTDFEEQIDSQAWEYVWKSTDIRRNIQIAAAVIGAILFYFLGSSFNAPTTMALAGVIVGGVGGTVATNKLEERGTELVEEYHPEIYDYATSEIETTAKTGLGATGPDVSTYMLEEPEYGDGFVSVPERYSLRSVVVDNSSLGVVDSAWINFPAVKFGSGQVAQEFFYDQVTRLNYENDSLVIHLSDGSKHTWPAETLSSRAVQDIRDRIRAYK